jgi:hypothetical protein
MLRTFTCVSFVCASCNAGDHQRVWPHRLRRLVGVWDLHLRDVIWQDAVPGAEQAAHLHQHPPQRPHLPPAAAGESCVCACSHRSCSPMLEVIFLFLLGVRLMLILAVPAVRRLL